MSKLTPEAIDSLLKAQTRHLSAAMRIRDALHAIREVTHSECVVIQNLNYEDIQDVVGQAQNKMNEQLSELVIQEAQGRIVGLCKSLTLEAFAFQSLLGEFFPELDEAKADAEPVSEPSGTLEHKILNWLANNGTGQSSETMAYCAAGVLDPKAIPWHPGDADDLSRCIGLVEAVPEVKDRFGSVRELSAEWESIIDHWYRLVSTYQEDRRAGTRFAKTDLILRSLLADARANAVDRQKDA